MLRMAGAGINEFGAAHRARPGCDDQAGARGLAQSGQGMNVQRRFEEKFEVHDDERKTVRGEHVGQRARGRAGAHVRFHVEQPTRQRHAHVERVAAEMPRQLGAGDADALGRGRGVSHDKHEA